MIPLLVLVLLLWTPPSCQSQCTGLYGSVCCSGYMLDKALNRCIKCPDGFVGDKCTRQCLFPTYGFRCQGNCDCAKHLCDFSKGCIRRTTTVKQIKSTTKDIETTSVTELKQQETNSLLIPTSTGEPMHSTHDFAEHIFRTSATITGTTALNNFWNFQNIMIAGMCGICCLILIIVCLHFTCHYHNRNKSSITKDKNNKSIQHDSEDHYFEIELSNSAIGTRPPLSQGILFEGLTKAKITHLNSSSYLIEFHGVESKLTEEGNKPFRLEYQATIQENPTEGGYIAPNYQTEMNKTHSEKDTTENSDSDLKTGQDYLSVVADHKV
ncbi:uncharacterized protein LOC134238072 [Saccostrea cucullata]|uniref:uncharacterized protein LOC134238072 n=1 Tax=Saccostrea cuccullata TaxID=36930 RepID=UPI002ED0E45C